MNYCFFNGKILPFDDVKININELGLLRAYAVFDYLRTYNGKPFRIDDYLKRFRNSATELHLRLKYSDEEIKFFVNELLKKNKREEVGIRFLLTGGYTHDSMSITKPNFFILIEEIPEYRGAIFSGVKLMSCEFQRWLPQVKTTNYVNAIRLQGEKEKQNAFEILYHYKNEISETARNNFFIVKKGILITPKENILLGITRKVILEISAKHKIKTEERKLFLSELKDIDEAFITGSSKGIVPVVQIDKIKIGNGKVGKVTKRLIELWEDYTLVS